jgi:tetratricopeptide (TPR) repeat protein
MVDEEEFDSSETGENVMLQRAIEAIRIGDRARARDLLTRLLKADQKNANVWVWLSVTVDTAKERLFCLQTAIQLDPQNPAAKRGLIMLGALPPDDSVPPFPVNRPRLWEEKLAMSLKPADKPRGWANPVTRVFLALGLVIILLGLFIGGYMLLHKPAKPVLLSTPTRRPTATRTLTPTDTPIATLRTATPTFLGPTPLWMFLEKTYTPTPLYVVTEHPILSRSAYESGLRFLGAQDYKNALALFQQAQSLEPGAPDIDYYIGEIYRAQGSYRTARDYYQKAINKNANFAPAFLGRARANLALNPDADVSSDLDEAVQLDPNFAEAHIERGKYLLPTAAAKAKADFQTALEISPDSALANYYLAEAHLALGENKAALLSAQRANEIDITLIPVYLTLAKAYITTGQSELAVSVLQTYTVYEPNDTGAFLSLGIAYNAAGNYQQAINILNKVVTADRKNAEAYYQRGYAYLSLQKASLAEGDFKSAIAYDPRDFDAQLGLGRAYEMQKKPGDAYMQIEQKAHPLAKTDLTKAQVYYWEAITLEEIGDPLSAEGARNAWTQLIALPAEAMPEEWRVQAFEHLEITPTFTPTLTPTITPTFTLTLSPTITLTLTPRLSPTFSPTVTPTPSPAKTSTPTPTPTKTPSPTATPTK